MSRIYTEDIQKIIEKDGWAILSEEYLSLDGELVFLCPEGHRVYNSWRNMRNQRKCPVCEQGNFQEEEMRVIERRPGEQRVLALDQATYKSGWSIFSDGKLLKYGTFETQLSDEIARDVMVKNWLISMVRNWKPDLVALEGIQFQQNMGVTTFETLARLQGILMASLHESETPYVICHTQSWRAHCGVKGRARADKKKSMQLLAKKWFNINVSNDCADAIGIGKYVAETNLKQPKIEDWE